MDILFTLQQLLCYSALDPIQCILFRS